MTARRSLLRALPLAFSSGLAVGALLLPPASSGEPAPGGLQFPGAALGPSSWSLLDNLPAPPRSPFEKFMEAPTRTVSRMPVLPPREVDPRMPVKAPDPSVHYELEIINPLVDAPDELPAGTSPEKP